MASPSGTDASMVLYSLRAARSAGRRICGTVLGGSRGGRHEFVSRDLRRDAHAAVVARLDADDLPLAADIDIARLRNQLRKGDHEFDLAADFEIGVREEIETAVTDIPCVGV